MCSVSCSFNGNLIWRWVELLRGDYLYNSSHELGSDIQRVVFHHVKGHSAHHKHMLLIVEVHTAVNYRRDKPVSLTLKSLAVIR